MHSQLILPIEINEQRHFDSFVSSQNAGFIKHIKNQIDAHSTALEDKQVRCFKGIYVWGEPSVGKSHLLHALAHYAHKKSLSVALCQFEKLPKARADLYLLDDIETFLTFSEEPLLTFIEGVKQENALLIISAKQAVKALGLGLQDLASRLLAMDSFELHSLDEAEKREVIHQRALHRGIVLSEEVINWMFRHTSRDLSMLLNLLDQIDSHSLAAHRKVTIPFIKTMLRQ